jgi:hypothetical protein
MTQVFHLIVNIIANGDKLGDADFCLMVAGVAKFKTNTVVYLMPLSNYSLLLRNLGKLKFRSVYILV